MAEAGGAARLPARSTRGNRMGQLLNEAKEEGDDEFWGQEAFAEEERDDAYASEAEEVDQFDSDFNESEDEADEEEGDGDERPRKRAALRPPGEPKRHKPPPGALRPGAALRALSELEGLVAGVEGEGGEAAPARAKAQKAAAEVTADMLRKSKRSTVLELDVQRERAAAVAAARPKAKVRRVVEERPLTQAEMLAEAVHTESLNQASLARILAMEEEHKKRNAVVKRQYSGPVVRFRSRGGAQTLTFANGAHVARSEAPQPHAPRVCAVTGAPAKYRDPQTRLPYASAAALKALRAAAAAGALAQLPYAQHADLASAGAHAYEPHEEEEEEAPAPAFGAHHRRASFPFAAHARLAPVSAADWQ